MASTQVLSHIENSLPWLHSDSSWHRLQSSSNNISPTKSNKDFDIYEFEVYDDKNWEKIANTTVSKFLEIVTEHNYCYEDLKELRLYPSAYNPPHFEIQFVFQSKSQRYWSLKDYEDRIYPFFPQSFTRKTYSGRIEKNVEIPLIDFNDQDFDKNVNIILNHIEEQKRNKNLRNFRLIKRTTLEHGTTINAILHYNNHMVGNI